MNVAVPQCAHTFVSEWFLPGYIYIYKYLNLPNCPDEPSAYSLLTVF